ncbi:hypothetical protein DFQ26_003030 [Actinomortierella ambigua]|nr:hypothetical protein DFQ26_003030 [Actinomortierella ambigua]
MAAVLAAARVLADRLGTDLAGTPSVDAPETCSHQRAKLIAASDFIQGHDVLIFQEVWDMGPRFAYVQLNRTGTPIHVIGTHLQSEDNLCAHPNGVATVQRAQLGELRTFIDQLNIPPTELVIAGGDFNINRGSAEYHILLSTLQADPPTSWSGAPFSWDADHNSLAVLTSPEESRLRYLDYILTFATHAKVASNVQKAINIQAPLIVDLNKEYHDYSAQLMATG